MRMINENIVLDFYLEQIEKDKIDFLKEEDEYKKEVKRYIIDLKNSTDMHNKIQIAKELWKILFEVAMSHIDRDKRGYDELFNFFDEYVDFEELIFASDSFYRDHTIHCLWVYFLGEYIYKNKEFDFLFKRMNYDYNTIKMICLAIRELNITSGLDEVLKNLEVFQRIESRLDAIRCITSLTHDLGYPLKKIHKINRSIGRVLPYFSINNYSEFNFEFDNVQVKFIENFIEFLSNEVSISIGGTGEDKLKLLGKIFEMDKSNGTIIEVKIDVIQSFNDEEIETLKRIMNPKFSLSKNMTKELRYSNDFEQYQHGIMSAFLLIKTVGAFRNMTYMYEGRENLNLNNFDVSDIQAKLHILEAISDHTSSGYKIKSISNPSALLTFIDELEEFSRISRANQNRQYINEFCKTSLYVEEDTLHIDFIFDNEDIEHLDPERAFKGRCKRFLTLFDIPNLDDDLKLKLKCISMLSHSNNIYELEIGKCYVNITINGEEQDIPNYLGSREFYSKEKYMTLI